MTLRLLREALLLDAQQNQSCERKSKPSKCRRQKNYCEIEKYLVFSLIISNFAMSKSAHERRSIAKPLWVRAMDDFCGCIENRP